MTIYTLDEVQDELIGKVGTPNRDRFEYELQMDLINTNFTNYTKISIRKIRVICEIRVK